MTGIVGPVCHTTWSVTLSPLLVDAEAFGRDRQQVEIVMRAKERDHARNAHYGITTHLNCGDGADAMEARAESPGSERCGLFMF